MLFRSRGREVQHKLNFDTWVPAADEFIAALSPELQERLQQWRDRKQEPPGVDAILEARRPNEELYGLDKKGDPEGPNSKELFYAVWDVLESELGMTKQQFIALREEGGTGFIGSTTPAAPAPAPAPIPQATPGSGYLWELQPPPPK